jgi:cell shape-determining protein MreC
MMRETRRRIVMAALFLVAVGIIFLPSEPVDVTKQVRAWAAPVFAPLWVLTEGWALDLSQQIREPGRDGPTVEQDMAALVTRIEALQDALAQAGARIGEYERRVKDLSQIRQGLDGLPCRLIPARLIAPEVAGGRAGALLAEGTGSGVRKGSAVVARGIDRGAALGLERGEVVLTAVGLVGIVDEVGPLTSTVRLLTDPRTRLMVQVVMRRDEKWRAGPTGLAKGTEDGTAVCLVGIPRTADVAVGDFVVTNPSPESPLPAYLIVGRIVRCELKPAAPFYDIQIEPRVAPGEAFEVFVLAPAEPPKP